LSHIENCHANFADRINVVSTKDPVVPSPSSSSPIVVVDNVANHIKHESIENNVSAISHHPINASNSNNINNNNNTTAKVASSKTLTTKENNLLAIPANSCSTITSESGDNLSLCDGNSIDSLEVKMWHKSESESVGPSCSSISMDCSADEAVFEFMRRFVSILFTDSLAITLELKHQFGQYARVSKKNIFYVCEKKNVCNRYNLSVTKSLFYFNLQNVLFNDKTGRIG
jgi:hypothetical protein